MQKRHIVLMVALETVVIIVVLKIYRSDTSNISKSLPMTNPMPTTKQREPAIPADTATIHDIQDGLGAIVSTVRPAVVTISANVEFPNPAHRAGIQLLAPFPSRVGWVGSGVIVDANGYVLTNRQVTGDANSVRVSLFRGGRNIVSAVRVATDEQSDLVLLKLPFGGNLPYASLGNSSNIHTGDIVVALGSSFGLAETVTHGIVSANRREVTIGNRQYTNVIQTDASINQGNCGGPLVSINAEVIGMNMAIYSTDSSFSGIGFAIASNQARAFISRALNLFQ